jgi:RHS repeat-associated protein
VPFELDRLAEYTDDAILGEIRRVAERVHSMQLSITEFSRHARVSTNTIRRRFGSWQSALQKAGLADRAPSSPNITKSAVASRALSGEDIASELRRVARLVGRSTVTIKEFHQHSPIGVGAVRSRFGSWHKGLAAAGLGTVALGRRYTDEECYENLMRIWTLRGRPPQYREMNLAPSTVGGKAYTKRWGTWNKALAAFSERVSQDFVESTPDVPPRVEAGRPVRVPPVDRDVRDPPLSAEGSESFGYDAAGNLVEVAWPGGRIELARDPLGRIVREAQKAAGHEHVIETSYDALGQRVGRRTSLGHTEAVTRDVLGGRVRTLLDGDLELTHALDAFSREVSRGLPGGGVVTSVYDPLGRLSQRRVAGPGRDVSVGAGEPDWVGRSRDATTAMLTYRYDPASELVASIDRARGTTEYRYDPVGQLVAAVPEKARREVFHYDPAGNLHEGDGAPARVYGQGNRLLRKGDTEYRWDDHGRLVEKREREEVWKYAWNEAGLLAAVDTPSGERVELEYDPFARRVQKRVTAWDAATAKRALVRDVRFVWDGDVLVHELVREVKERAASAGDPVVAVRTYCFEDDSFVPAAHREADGRWVHYINDPAGAPEKLVDGRAEVLCELERGAWELRQPAGARASTPIRFQGQYEDEETGLHYNRARYFDPATARYISLDPTGLAGGVNVFRYARNPLMWVDPLGTTDFFRGGSDLTPRTMRDGKSEFRSPDPTRPDVQSRGVSLFSNQDKTDRFGGSFKVTALPPELAIEQRGKDKEHFEIVAKSPMTEEEYRKALQQVKLERTPPRSCG